MHHRLEEKKIFREEKPLTLLRLSCSQIFHAMVTFRRHGGKSTLEYRAKTYFRLSRCPPSVDGDGKRLRLPRKGRVTFTAGLKTCDPTVGDVEF